MCRRSKMSQVELNLKARIRKLQSPDEMVKFISSEDVSLFAMKSGITTQCQDEGEIVTDGDSNNFKKRVMSDRGLLELLVFSGGCASMKGALNLLEVLLDLETQSTMPIWKLHLAVATALTFSTEVRQAPPFVGLPHYVGATATAPVIDGVQRYRNFVRWTEQGLVFDGFYDLSAWHMRQIVGASVPDDELKWAYNNAKPRSYASPGKIGYIPVVMVNFREERLGVWFEELEKFYRTSRVTLQTVHLHGGATGAMSHFGTAMSQIHGAPAAILFNPTSKIVTHAWCQGGTNWVLANKRAGDWKDLYILPGYVCQCPSGENGRSCILHSRSEDYVKNVKLVPALTLLEMTANQARPDTWKMAHNAMCVARLMQEEWRLSEHFPGFANIFTSFSGGSLQENVHILGGNPGWTLAKALNYVPLGRKLYSRQILPIKRCTIGRNSVDLYLEHMSEVESLDLQWYKKKVLPERIEISYKCDGKTVLSTSNQLEVPPTLVDGVSLHFFYEKDFESFNMFKMLRFCTYGVSYNRTELLTTIIDQRLEGNAVAKMCLKFIQERLQLDT